MKFTLGFILMAAFSATCIAEDNEMQAAKAKFIKSADVQMQLAKVTAEDKACVEGDVNALSISSRFSPGGWEASYVVAQNFKCSYGEQKSVTAFVKLSQVTGTAKANQVDSVVTLLLLK